MTLHLKTWVVTPGLLQPLSTEGAGFSWSVMCHSHRPRDEEHTISLLASIRLPQAMQDLRRCAPACSHPVCFSCDSCSTCTFACNCVEPRELPRWRESMRVKTKICAIESGKIFYMDLLFLYVLVNAPRLFLLLQKGVEQSTAANLLVWICLK